MNDKKIRSSETTVKVALILRLCGIAALIFWWVQSYMYPNYFEKDFNGSGHLIIMIFCLALDALLTVTWHYSFKLYIVHSIIFMLLGGVFYFFFVADTFNFKLPYRFSIWELYDIFEIGINAAVVWCLSLIPFIICAIGNNDLARAKFEQKQIK